VTKGALVLAAFICGAKFPHCREFLCQIIGLLG